MSEFAYIFLILFVSTGAEVMAGSFGVLLPAAALAVFYLSVAYGLEIGLAGGAAAGTALDLLYGRGLLLSPWLLMLSACLAFFWLHRGDTKILLMHVLPGAAVALAATLPYALSIQMSDGNLLDLASREVLSMILGAVLLPAMIWSLDKAALYFGFEDFRGAKQRNAERSK